MEDADPRLKKQNLEDEDMKYLQRPKVKKKMTPEEEEEARKQSQEAKGWFMRMFTPTGGKD